MSTPPSPATPRWLCIAPDDAAAAGLRDAWLAAHGDPGAELIVGGPCHTLVQQQALVAPALVIVQASGDELLQALVGWHGATPCPVVWIGMSSSPANPGLLAALAEAGLAGGYATMAAASPAALAWECLRWQREAGLRRERGEAQAELDDRKWLERAKGILSQARGFSEDEAFRLLRGTAMHAKLKLGEVSRAVVEASVWADAVNRAGQLRMLSQRLVKLAAQRLAGLDLPRTRQWHDDSMQRAQDALDHLAAWPASAGPLGEAAGTLAQVQSSWLALQQALAPRLTPAALSIADARAGALLQQAETLVAQLEQASHRQPLRVVNLCGRQRMLAQRFAKDALLADMLPGGGHATRLAPAAGEFEAALAELEQAPLSSREIRQSLATARQEWSRLQSCARALQSNENRLALARSSEALLSTFDELTTQYEHSMQILMS